MCRGGKGWSRIRFENKGGIFTDYYFGEANTANNTCNHHNNAINKKINWGGISGLLQSHRIFMLIFVVSVLFLFLAAAMFSSCALMFTFIFQELLIILGLNSL